tara:strand:+ start:57 stop:257 length:201 start_codon:yes stop_codon:yes gene_type:complete
MISVFPLSIVNIEDEDKKKIGIINLTINFELIKSINLNTENVYRETRENIIIKKICSLSKLKFFEI